MAMSLQEAIVEGTLNPDGTLELDQRPNLSPGRVTVTLRHEGEAPRIPQDNWFEFMLNARKQMEDAGCPFLDEKAVQAHIDWIREGDMFDDLLREAEETRKKSEKPSDVSTLPARREPAVPPR
jgi:hypothetical protein